MRGPKPSYPISLTEAEVKSLQQQARACCFASPLVPPSAGLFRPARYQRRQDTEPREDGEALQRQFVIAGPVVQRAG